MYLLKISFSICCCKNIFEMLFELHYFSFVCSVGLKTQPETKCPELLANYCDMLLRKTPLSKKLTSEEIEARLKEVVSEWVA